MELSSICLAILLFLTLYILTQHFLHKIQNLPPCPFPILPVISHLYLLKKPLHINLSKLSIKHGPVLFLQLGSRGVLIVSSPAAAEECLSNNDIIFANRPHLIAGKHFGQNYTSLAWSSYGDHWRNLRRIASTELLSSNRIQALSIFRTDEVRLTIQHLFQKCRNNDLVYQKVDMRSMLFEVTFNSITRMLAGKRFCGDRVVDTEEATRFQEIIGEQVKLMAKSNNYEFLPFLRWFSFEEIHKMCKNAQKKRDVFVQNWIEGFQEIRSNVDAHKANRDRTMIEILLSLQEKDPEYYTDEMIRSLMMTLLTAATNTSADTMEWTMTHLLNNPEILSKSRAEIDDIVGQQRWINESDVAQLHYLKLIIMETLRMHPVLPLLLPHESSKDCMVGGFCVPVEQCY